MVAIFGLSVVCSKLTSGWVVLVLGVLHSAKIWVRTPLQLNLQ